MAQSIGGENLLSLGLRHSIGNRFSTNISHAKWIPTLKELSLSSFHKSRGPEKKVVELIDSINVVGGKT